MLHALTTKGYCPVTAPALNTYLRLQCLPLTSLSCLLIAIVLRWNFQHTSLHMGYIDQNSFVRYKGMKAYAERLSVCYMR